MEKTSDPGGGKAASALEGTEVRFAFRPFARLRGLIARGGYGGVLVIAPCRDIHTVGMTVPIDVAFLDEGGAVLEAHRAVGPFRRLRNRRAACVIERYSRCGAPWFRPGERVVLSAIAPAADERSDRS